MRAARFVGVGHPVELQDLDRPALTGSDDVLVQVAGAGVCRTDLHVLEGVSPLQPPPPPPFTLGHETAGWVREVGSSVTTVAPGDAVLLHPAVSCGLCRSCRKDAEMQCSRIRFPGLDGSDGGFAEYVRTSIRSVVRVPAGIDLVESAPLADAGLTAYHAVRRIRDSLGPGSVVVVVGAGGLGHLGIQFLRALTPSRIVAVDLRGELRDAAHRLGAETAYPPEDPHLRDWIRSETGGEGVDAVLDFVAEGDTPRSSLGLLRRGGTYSIVGYGGTLTVPTVEMVTRELRVLGNFVGTHEDLLGVLALAGAHQVRTTVRRYPLNEAPRAIEDLRSGAVVGRAVLTP